MSNKLFDYEVTIFISSRDGIDRRKEIINMGSISAKGIGTAIAVIKENLKEVVQS